MGRKPGITGIEPRGLWEKSQTSSFSRGRIAARLRKAERRMGGEHVKLVSTDT